MSLQLETIVLGTLPLANFTANGVLGTAAATVDICPCFAIAQTTTAIALTIPSPTVTTAGLTISIVNTGTVQITIAGVVIGTGQSGSFVWSGTAWATIVSIAAGISQPTNQVIFGTGTAVGSSANATINPTTGVIGLGGTTPGITLASLPFNLNSGSGNIFIGADAVAKTVTVGNQIGNTALALNAGSSGTAINSTGPFTLNTGSAAISVGTDNVAKTILLGNQTGATALSLNSGTGSTTINTTGGFNTNITGNCNLQATGQWFIHADNSSMFLRCAPVSQIVIGDTLSSGTVNLGSGVSTTVIAGKFQHGSTVIGNINARFSTLTANTFSGPYGFLTSGGAGTNAGSTGSVNYSAEFDGRVRFNAEIDVFSDVREKFNITTLEPARCLDIVTRLRSVSFNRLNHGGDKTVLGFIAQEVGEAGLGEAVTVTEGMINGEIVPDHHALSPDAMIATLWSAVRELTAKVNALQSAKK